MVVTRKYQEHNGYTGKRTTGGYLATHDKEIAHALRGRRCEHIYEVAIEFTLGSPNSDQEKIAMAARPDARGLDVSASFDGGLLLEAEVVN